jgi:hypothetical protein
MPLNAKALGATLGILAIVSVTIAAPVFAQQTPPAAGQEPPPDAQSPSGPPPDAQLPNGPPPVAQSPSGPPPNGQPPNGQPPQAAPVHPGPVRSALVVSNVNLRSGPGTDSEIIATIPGGSTVQITSCSGEWCAVTWNGRSGYAIARNLSTGGLRHAGQYRAPPGYADGPPVGYGPPGYYPPPPVVYGPGYYRPGYYYGPGWGWRRGW